MRRSEADEIKYTTHKIESNFSNFSAWHQRSLVYSRLWEANPAAKAAALDAGASDYW
jgi:geranylgeranyl transferase type-2 subunit alpha